jgi:hypothetical protein
MSDTVTIKSLVSKKFAYTIISSVSVSEYISVETIQALCRFKFFWIKILVSLHHSKLLGFKAIQSLYLYFPQVIEYRYRFN